MRLELVIFDCDGVLIDSEAVSARGLSEVFWRHGYPITPEAVLQRFTGVSDRDARIMVEREICRRFPDDFDQQVEAATLQLYGGEVTAIAHVAEAIKAIELPKCVASSSTLVKIRHGLSCAGLQPSFDDHIFSALQVKCGKPAPDLFSFAAAQMNTSPERCLVVEDSVPGVTGARAAGMTVLGFHGGSHCRAGHGKILRNAGAAATFNDMRQLPPLIAQIGQKAGQAAGFSPPQAISERRAWKA